MSQEMRFALRQLHKYPGFSLTVILTLALGIGLNTAVFSMVNGFLLRALPYPQPQRMAALLKHNEGIDPRSGKPGSEEDNNFNSKAWQILKENVKGLTSAAYGGSLSYGDHPSSGVNLKTDAATGGVARYVHASSVSAHYFDVLGIPLYRGRSFTETEDSPQGPPVAVLSYRLWATAFDSDSQMVGKTIQLKGEPYTVVGVLGPNAQTPGQADVFTPLRPEWSKGQCGAGDNCGILVRLQPGWTWEQVNAQLSHIRLPYFTELETQYRGRAWIYARPLQLELTSGVRERVTVLMLAVSFILLIACANLAGLALIRLSRRTQEMATRLALGASSFAVLRQLWVEALVLALLGAAGGLGLAVLVLDGVQGFLPPEMMPIGGFTLDTRVLTFTLSTSLVASFLFGALPALGTRRLDLRSAIAAGSRAVLGGSNRLRQGLIGAEVALTVVLLAAAGLLVRTLIHLETLPPGFDPHHVMTAKASLDDVRYHEAAAFRTLLAKSVAALREIPGVQDAAFGLSLPYERGLNSSVTIMDGSQAGKESMSTLVYVTPGYFSTLRVPLLAGRSFSESDNSQSQFVTVVNTAFAQRLFGNRFPVGRHFKAGNVPYTVVGVVADVVKRPGHQGTAPIDTEPVCYIPVLQVSQDLVNLAHIWFQPSWMVRTNGPISGLTGEMQRTLAKTDPNLPVSGFYSMEQILAEQLQRQRIEVLLLTTLAGLALLLSAVGLYALVSNLVVQRTREIGIRIALGCTVQQAMLQVGSSGVVAAAGGIVSGIALSLLAVPVLSSEIYGVRPYDPVTFLMVPLLLAAIAGVASFLPALRISRIQPSDALRSE